MLPSNPRPGRATGGNRPLVSTRSRSASRPRQDGFYDKDAWTTSGSNQPSAYREVRPQRSMANLTSNRASESRERPSPHPYISRPSTAASQASSSRASSTSSSGSSLLDRMKVRSGSNSSSRTSLEEDQTQKRAKGVWPLPRERMTVEGAEQVDYAEPNEGVQATAGYGSSIWNRVASAAGSLAINVNLSWASNIASYAGEETPLGQESRLIRAMKAYHLGKARDPSDLPPWLFEEHERRTATGYTRDGYNEYEQNAVQERPSESRQRGLRDIYDAATAPSGQPKPSSRPLRGEDSGTLRAGAEGGGASNRLKAIRDSKRNATTATRSAADQAGPVSAEARDERYGSRSDTVVYRGDRDGSSARRLPARIGLPSGPGKPRVRGY